jgi:Uma2 family endonuclease
MTDLLISESLLSLDDLLLMGDARVEIVNGVLTEMSAAGMTHQLIARNVQRPFDAYTLEHGNGEVFSDGLTYLMFSETKGLKDSFVPDVSFIRNENLLPMTDSTKPYPGVPDLAVEVVSPGDDADKLMLKVRTYLEKGTEQVFLLYQTVREVHQYRQSQHPEVRVYRGDEPLDLEAFFPGLTLTPAMIFALPKWAIRQMADG